MTDEELMDIARPFAADGGRWPSDWLSAMRAAMEAEREACAKVCESMGALDAMDGEDEGSAAMVRVADRQADLCAAAIRERSSVELTGAPTTAGDTE